MIDKDQKKPITRVDLVSEEVRVKISVLITSIMRPFFRHLEQVARLFFALATGIYK
jgi:hypothetical protein